MKAKRTLKECEVDLAYALDARDTIKSNDHPLGVILKDALDKVTKQIALLRTERSTIIGSNKN